MQYTENNERDQRYVTIRKGSFFLTMTMVAVAAVAATFFILSYFSPSVFGSRSISTTKITDKDMEKYQRLEETLRYIEANYIGEIDEQEMINQAIKGLVYGSGDKYAQYFTPEEAQEFTAQNEGKYAGIGVVVNIDEQANILTVTQVYKNTPAEKAGFLAGDIIYKVDGEEVIGLPVNEVVDMVKGDPGTEVVVTIMRGDKEIDMTMMRAEIIAERAEWKMVEGNIAYIKLYEFNGNCGDLFHQAVKELVTVGGAQGMILDLRYNPGGDKGIVVDIADTFLPKGPIITLVDNKGNSVVDSSDVEYLGIPLVVLVNEHSASASELLSGAIQDYEGIGVIMGETTYGKGVAQGFTSWIDGALLKLTTSKYLTPSGRCPQDVGIIPDIEVVLNEEVVNDPKLLTTEKDNQMQEAIRVVKDIITGKYKVD